MKPKEYHSIYERNRLSVARVILPNLFQLQHNLGHENSLWKTLSRQNFRISNDANDKSFARQT